MRVVFDLSAGGFQGWSPLLEFGLMSVIASGAAFYAQIRYKPGSVQRRSWTMAAVSASILSLSWGLFLCWLSHEEYITLIQAYRAKQFAVVEGRVLNFKPALGGHGEDSFDVGGRHFAYWVASNSSAFHNSDGSLGGLAGTRVRVFFVEDKIVRIE